MIENNSLSELEDMLVRAMCSNARINKKTGEKKRSTRGSERIKRESYDEGAELGLRIQWPNSAYTMDLSDDERLYSKSHEDLVLHPIEIIQDKEEVLLLDSGLITWCCFKRIRKPPRGCAAAGTGVHWFEFHHRFSDGQQLDEYNVKIVAVSKSGKVIPVMRAGRTHSKPGIDGKSLMLCCSIIEDAHRANTMLLKIKESVELKLPVPLSDYKAELIDRSAPLSETTGRRRPIVHWVASHMRKRKAGATEIPEHTRGVSDLEIDGFTINITPNARWPESRPARSAA